MHFHRSLGFALSIVALAFAIVLAAAILLARHAIAEPLAPLSAIGRLILFAVLTCGVFAVATMSLFDVVGNSKRWWFLMLWLRVV